MFGTSTHIGVPERDKTHAGGQVNECMAVGEIEIGERWDQNSWTSPTYKADICMRHGIFLEN